LQTYIKREELWRKQIFSQKYLTLKVLLKEAGSASPTEENTSQSHYMQTKYVKNIEISYQEDRNNS